MDAQMTNEPHDICTHLANVGVKAIEEIAEGPVKIIITITLDQSDGSHMGGIAMSGYEDNVEALSDWLTHLKMAMNVSGKEMKIGFMNEDGTTWV